MQELWWKPVKDRDGHYWFIPLGKEHEWNVWVESANGVSSVAPPWALRLREREE
jgi:hypothetical protein